MGPASIAGPFFLQGAQGFGMLIPMKTVGKYLIEEELLTTGFSDIYIAKDPDLLSTVAVKVFHPKGDNVGEKAQYGADFWRARFIEEARLLSRFDHPNIVNVMYMGALDTDTPYFVMPFLEANLLYEIGEDANSSEEIAKIDPKWQPRAISPRRAVEVWRQVLDALAELHGAGLVHRDIKPPNILLTSKQRGRVKICDFGMVKVPNAAGSRGGIWVGTLEYISPEQRASATEVGPESDVYSAAVVMYRMLTGQLPEQKRAPLRAGRLGIPQDLAMLIDECLNTDKSKRPKDAAQVLVRLDEIVPVISALSKFSKIHKRIVIARVIKKESTGI